MPRRKNILVGEAVALAFDHAAVTADTTMKLWKVPAGRSFRITGVDYINETGLAGHASDFFNLKILKGSTVMANWSTDSAAEGTLTADTFVAFVLSATDANQVAQATDVISLFMDETGTASLPAGRFVLRGQLL